MNRCIIIAPLYRGEEREWLTPREGDLLMCAYSRWDAAMSSAPGRSAFPSHPER